MFDALDINGLRFPLTLNIGDVLHLPIAFKNHDGIITGRGEFHIAVTVGLYFTNIDHLENYYFGKVEQCKPT